MSQALYTLAFLACPLGMGAMMWMTNRGNRHQPNEDAGRQTELIRMQAEIDQLRAAERDRSAPQLTTPADQVTGHEVSRYAQSPDRA